MLHADDLMKSHTDLAIETDHVKKLDSAHSDKDPFSVTRGKLYEYLGMMIGFGLKRGVAIS